MSATKTLANQLLELSYILHDYDLQQQRYESFTQNQTINSTWSTFSTWPSTSSTSSSALANSTVDNTLATLMATTNNFNLPSSISTPSTSGHFNPFISSAASSASSSSSSLVDFVSQATSSACPQQKQDLANNNINFKEKTNLEPQLSQQQPQEPRAQEIVTVPSSAHVSYIVGKQGAKIRQIRTQTETLIQTPVNGEEPVFIIRGRASKVAQAAERIRTESRAYDASLYFEACNGQQGPSHRLNLYLPSRFIGLVVGKQGSAIKRIMAASGAQIVTPKVNTLNGFKLAGTDSQLRTAVHLVKHHIASTDKYLTITERAVNLYEIHLDISNDQTHFV